MRQIYKLLNFRNRAMEILRYTYDNMERSANTYKNHGGRADLPRRRDYCGNHIYRNGVLERVLNDVGYADSTGYHYQVKDYRGDVRAVVAQNGTLEETNKTPSKEPSR